MFYEKAETELSLFTQVSLKGDKGLTEHLENGLLVY